MKALSWKEPYASLMLKGKIETRSWATNYRGKVLICATRRAFTLTDLSAIAGAQQLSRIRQRVPETDYLRSKAIAVATLSDCRPMTKADEDLCFVKFKEGLYCHIYTDVQPIEPFFWTGVQGWSKVPEVVVESIVYLNQQEL